MSKNLRKTLSRAQRIEFFTQNDIFWPTFFFSSVQKKTQASRDSNPGRRFGGPAPRHCATQIALANRGFLSLLHLADPKTKKKIITSRNREKKTSNGQLTKWTAGLEPTTHGSAVQRSAPELFDTSLSRKPKKKCFWKKILSTSHEKHTTGLAQRLAPRVVIGRVMGSTPGACRFFLARNANVSKAKASKTKKKSAFAKKSSCVKINKP